MNFEKLVAGYKTQIIPKFESLRDTAVDPQQKRSLEETLAQLKKGLRSSEIQKRLVDLYMREEYFGYICFLSQLIEYMVKDSILQSQEIHSIQNKMLPNIKDLEWMTFGQLIPHYEKFVEDEFLIANLKKFNELRRKAIHRLFSPDFTIEDVEWEIKNELSPNIVYKDVVTPLSTYELALISQIGKLRHGVEISSFQEKAIKHLEKSVGFSMDKVNKNIKI